MGVRERMHQALKKKDFLSGTELKPAKTTFLFRKALTFMKGFEIQPQSDLGLVFEGKLWGKQSFWEDFKKWTMIRKLSW